MPAKKDQRAERSKPSRAAAQYPRVTVESRAALRSWLLVNHASSRGAWVVTGKRAAGGVVAWNDIVEESLCFGWVDSLPRKLDDQRSMLLITPRATTSKWSIKNQQHVLDLERRQLMHEAGRAAVAAARSSGTWNALDAVSALIVPADLAAALRSQAPADQHWEAFPPSTRRGILEWIAAAKRAETRAARIAETARLAKDNVRANQWPRASPDRKS